MKDENNTAVEKYCKDCKYCKYCKHIGYQIGYNYSSGEVWLPVCTNPAITRRDIITSEIVAISCSSARDNDTGRCKESAIYFEGKEKRIIQKVYESISKYFVGILGKS